MGAIFSNFGASFGVRFRVISRSHCASRRSENVDFAVQFAAFRGPRPLKMGSRGCVARGLGSDPSFCCCFGEFQASFGLQNGALRTPKRDPQKDRKQVSFWTNLGPILGGLPCWHLFVISGLVGSKTSLFCVVF